jgi:hypothetical protein
LVKSHHFYGEARNRVPSEVAALVRVVQEADCVSFALLRTPVSSFRSDADLDKAVEKSLRHLALSERILPAAKLTEQLINLDHEARKASTHIGVAYS